MNASHKSVNFPQGEAVKIDESPRDKSGEQATTKAVADLNEGKIGLAVRPPLVKMKTHVGLKKPQLPLTKYNEMRGNDSVGGGHFLSE